MEVNQKFPKAEKLKRQSQIKTLFTEGKVLKHYPIKLVFSIVDAKPNKVGVSVSKRSFKKAVDRNRIKRQIREAYRLNKANLKDTKNSYAIMFIYLSREKKEFADIQTAVKHLLGELQNHEA